MCQAASVDSNEIIDVWEALSPCSRAGLRYRSVVGAGQFFQSAVPEKIVGQVAMIAAIALLATRNTRDFEGCGVRVINPWVVG